MKERNEFRNWIYFQYYVEKLEIGTDTFENNSKRLIVFTKVSAVAFDRPPGLNGNKRNNIKNS